MKKIFELFIALLSIIVLTYGIFFWIIDLLKAPGEFGVDILIIVYWPMLIILIGILFCIYLLFRKRKLFANVIKYIVIILFIDGLFMAVAFSNSLNPKSLKQDGKICKFIPTKEGASYCFFESAIYKKDLLLCEKITDNHWNKMCYVNLKK
jgi:hypothetical protein